jgi:methionine-rich copper-binding protein CopC
MRFALIGAVLGLLVIAAAPVLGHAGLVSSDPDDGATITTPYTLTATFEEEFDPERSSLTVFDAAENEIATGQVDTDDEPVMFVELPELEPGEYTVRWTTVTSDDNGIERGEFTFNVVEAQQSAAPTARPTVVTTPAPTGSTGDGQPGSGNDVLLALVLAGIALVGVGLFVFNRMRR